MTSRGAATPRSREAAVLQALDNELAATHVLTGDKHSAVRAAEMATSRTVWTAEWDGNIRIRKLPVGQEIGMIERKDKRTFCSTLLLVENRMWAGLNDGSIRIFDPESGHLLHHVHQHDGPVHCLAFVAGRVYSGGADWKVFQWNPVDYSYLRLFFGHTNSVRSISGYQSASGENTIIFSGGDDAMIKAWDPHSPLQFENDVACAHTFRGHTKSVLALERIPGHRQLWSGSEDCTIKVWDIAGFTAVTSLDRHTGPVTSLQFVDSRIWSGGKDGMVFMWDVATFAPVKQLQNGVRVSDSYVLTVKRLFRTYRWKVWACASDGSIQCWNAECPMEDFAVEYDEHERTNAALIRGLREEMMEQMAQLNLQKDNVRRLEAELGDIEGARDTEKLAATEEQLMLVGEEREEYKRQCEILTSRCNMAEDLLIATRQKLSDVEKESSNGPQSTATEREDIARLEGELKRSEDLRHSEQEKLTAELTKVTEELTAAHQNLESRDNESAGPRPEMRDAMVETFAPDASENPEPSTQSTVSTEDAEAKQSLEALRETLREREAAVEAREAQVEAREEALNKKIQEGADEGEQKAVEADDLSAKETMTCVQEELESRLRVELSQFSELIDFLGQSFLSLTDAAQSTVENDADKSDFLYAEVEALRSDLDVREREVADLREVVASLEARDAASAAEINRLRELRSVDMKNRDSMLKQLSESEDRERDLCETIENQRTATKELRDELSDVKSRASTKARDSSSHERSELLSENEQLLQDRIESDRKLDVATKELEEQRRKASEAHSIAEERSSYIAALEEELTAAKETNRASDAEAAEKRSSLEEEVSKLQETVKSLQQDVERRSQQHQDPTVVDPVVSERDAVLESSPKEKVVHTAAADAPAIEGSPDETDAEAEKEALRDEVARLTLVEEQLEAEVQQLRQLLDDEEGKQVANVSRITDLESILEERQSSIALLKSALEERTQELNDAQRQVIDVEGSAKNLEAQNNALNESLTAARERVAELEKKLSEVSQVEGVADDLTVQLEDAMVQVAALKSRLAAAEENSKALKEELDEKQSLAADLAKSEAVVSDQKGQLEQRDRTIESLLEQAKAEGQSAEALAELQCKLDQVQSTLSAKIEEKEAELRSREAQSSEQSQEVETLKEDNQVLANEQVELHKKLAEQEEAMKALSDADDQLAAAHVQLRESDAATKELRSNVEELEEQLQVCGPDMAAELRSRISDLEVACSDRSILIVSLRQELEDLTKLTAGALPPPILNDSVDDAESTRVELARERAARLVAESVLRDREEIIAQLRRDISAANHQLKAFVTGVANEDSGSRRFGNRQLAALLEMQGSLLRESTEEVLRRGATIHMLADGLNRWRGAALNGDDSGASVQALAIEGPSTREVLQQQSIDALKRRVDKLQHFEFIQPTASSAEVPEDQPSSSPTSPVKSGMVSLLRAPMSPAVSRMQVLIDGHRERIAELEHSNEVLAGEVQHCNSLIAALSKQPAPTSSVSAEEASNEVKEVVLQQQLDEARGTINTLQLALEAKDEDRLPAVVEDLQKQFREGSLAQDQLRVKSAALEYAEVLNAKLIRDLEEANAKLRLSVDSENEKRLEVAQQNGRVEAATDELSKQMLVVSELEDTNKCLESDLARLRAQDELVSKWAKANSIPEESGAALKFLRMLQDEKEQTELLLESKERALEESRKRQAESLAEIEDLKGIVSQLRHEADEASLATEEAKDELKQAQRDLAQREKAAVESQQALHALDGELTNCRQELKEFESNCESLTEQLKEADDAAKKRAREFSDLEEKSVALSGKFDNAEDENTTLRERLRSSVATIESLKGTLETQKDSFAAFVQENDNLRSRLSSEAERRKTLELETSAAKDARITAESQLSSERVKSREEASSWQNRLDAQEKELHSAKREQTLLQDRNEALSRDVSQGGKELTSVRGQLAVANEQVAHLQSQAESLESRLAKSRTLQRADDDELRDVLRKACIQLNIELKGAETTPMEFALSLSEFADHYAVQLGGLSETLTQLQKGLQVLQEYVDSSDDDEGDAHESEPPRVQHHKSGARGGLALISAELQVFRDAALRGINSQSKLLKHFQQRSEKLGRENSKLLEKCREYKVDAETIAASARKSVSTQETPVKVWKQLQKVSLCLSERLQLVNSEVRQLKTMSVDEDEPYHDIAEKLNPVIESVSELVGLLKNSDSAI